MEAATVIAGIANGKLCGRSRDGVVSFKGVPYVATTSGSNRFMAPRPVASWTGLRQAEEFGDRSPQQYEDFADTPVFSCYRQNEPLSEDCCVLNVYCPERASSARPVLVYIAGGGFITGGGGGDVLDGSNLAIFGDVVVVTVNHRLGVLGYADLNHVGPNDFGDTANAGQLHNSPATPDWRAYDMASRTTMVIDVRCKAVNDYRSEERVITSALPFDQYAWPSQPLFNFRD